MQELSREEKLSRSVGSIVGLTTGDALGSTVEFMWTKDIFSKYGPKGQTEMRGGGAFHWKVGDYTDDGQMMMCLLESLVATGQGKHPHPGLNVEDLGRRFVDWYNSGPPDVGNTCRRSLERLRRGEAAAAEWGDGDPESQANGAVMRCAPVGILWHQPGQRAQLVRDSLLSAAPTHRSPVAAGACVVANVFIAEFLNGASFEEAFQQVLKDSNPEWQSLLKEWDQQGRPDRGNAGWAVPTLLTALHCLYSTTNYEDAVVKAVNNGRDADTVAAVCGQMAGAFYGVVNIPDRWLKVLKDRDKMSGLAGTLFQMGEAKAVI